MRLHDLNPKKKKNKDKKLLHKNSPIYQTPGIHPVVEDPFINSSSEEIMFTSEELKKINLRIESILETIEKLDVGHEIIYDEIESLRADAQKLSKKDFKSMAIGKLLSLGLDGLLDKNIVSECLHNLIGNDFIKYLE